MFPSFSYKNSKPKNNFVGLLGEDIANHFLVSIGYSVLGRNIKNKFGEIDLVCKSNDGVLVFVEVKTLCLFSCSHLSFSPEDNMSFSKISILKKICNFYANLYPEMIDNDLGWRIDLVSIIIPNNLNFAEKDFFYFYKNSQIKHYEGI